MKENELGPILLILVVGGVVIYLLTRPKVLPVPVVTDRNTNNSLGQCAGGYGGGTVSVPCALVGKGIKIAAVDTYKYALKPAYNYVIAPIGSGIATGAKDVYGAAKTAVHYIQPWNW